MSLENIQCPQFVDFTRNETFDINDGADFLFERRVMGEGVELGMFDENLENELDRAPNSGYNAMDADVEHITNVLSNATNLNKPQEMPLSHNSKPNQPVKVHHYQQQTVPKITSTNTTKSTQNKENSTTNTVITTKSTMTHASVSKTSSSLLTTTISSSDTAGIGGSTASVVSSAIELMSTSSGMQTKSSSIPTSNSSQAKQANTPIRKQPSPSITGGIKKQPPATFQYNNSNIVKKTFAKMTAAFKQSKPDQQSIKAKLSQNNKQSNKISKMIKDDFRLGNQNMDHLLEANTSTGNGGNRRASSVPRTLREKQELKKMATKDSVVNDILKDQNCEEVEETVEEKNLSLLPPTQTTTLGEKIQNFFNSHHSSTSTSSTNVASTLNNAGCQKNKQALFSKSKFTSAFSSTTGGPLKVIPSSKSSSMNTAHSDRRRSRSCNEAVRLTKTGNTTALNPRKSRLPTSESIDLTTGKNNTSVNKNNSIISSSNSNGNKGIVGRAIRSPSVNKTHVERQKSSERSTPQIALYQGVKFVPKITPKYQYTSESEKLDDLLKNRPMTLSKPHNYQHQQSNDNTLKKTSPNKRAPTPSKSASFKQQQNKLNISSSLETNRLHQNAAQKQPNQVTCAKKPPQMANTSSLNSHSDITTNGLSANTSCNLTRKKSECKPVLMCNPNLSANTSGLMMHTELRAQKRSEYDQHQKEKERQALLLRRDMEEEKMRRQQEEIQKIRMQRHTFRSRPIKHYKPVEVKPSEKPLTEPISPQLGTSLSTSSHISHNGRQQSRSRLKSASSMLSLHNFDSIADNNSVSNNLSSGPKMRAQNGSLSCLNINSNINRNDLIKSNENLNSASLKY